MDATLNQAAKEATERVEAARASLAAAKEGLAQHKAAIAKLEEERKSLDVALSAELPMKPSQAELAERLRLDARCRWVTRELPRLEAALPAKRDKIAPAEDALRRAEYEHARARVAELDEAVRDSDAELTEHLQAIERDVLSRLSAHNELLREAGRAEHSVSADKTSVDFTRRSPWAGAAGITAVKQPRLRIWEAVAHALDGVDSAERNRAEAAEQQRAADRFALAHLMGQHTYPFARDLASGARKQREPKPEPLGTSPELNKLPR